MPRLPLQIGDHEFTKRSDPPAAVGADTRELLTALGYSGDAIDALVERNVIAAGD
jgi:crotonobetainyl-CoA:carnitine CoA-transferase CaiB-like acyl-CoA transferase